MASEDQEIAGVMTMPEADESSQAEAPTGTRPPLRVGDLLVQRGTITQNQLEESLSLQKSSPGERLGQILIRKGYAKEEDVMAALAEGYSLDFVRVSQLKIPERVLALLPSDFCRRHKVIPIDADQEHGTVTVATADPANVFLLDELRRRLSSRVRLAVTTTAEINKTVDESMGETQEFQLNDLIRDIADDAVEVVAEEDDEVADLAKVAGESPVMRLVNYLICNAVKEGASDIHIEPGEKKMRIRYRIDGVLFEVMSPPQTMHPALDLAPQDHGQPRHFRAPPAPGRPHPGHRQQPPRRLPHQHPAHHPGREDRHPYSRQPVHPHRPRAARLRERPPHPVQGPGRAAARHRPRHRPHRLRQDDHALLGPA